MKKTLPLFGILLIIGLVKFFNLSIRISDTNIYFYTAYQLLQGKMLYKDIFFTNFPLFPYISSLYYFLVGTSITLYYFTAFIEVIIISILIYKIVLYQTKIYRYALLSSIIYSLSFIVLSTSDHQTGVFTASLFAVGGYYLYIQKRYFLSGILIGLTLLTKAYFIPFAVAIFLTLLFEKKLKNLMSTAGGFSLATLIVLAPFFIFAQKEIIHDIFEYSLTRSAGLDKIQILLFFLKRDFLFFFALLFNIIMIRKNIFFGIFSLTSLLFIFGYQDIYYLYLNFLIPLLCISLPSLFQIIEKKLNLSEFALAFFLTIILGFNVFLYLSLYLTLNKIESLDPLIKSIQKENPSALYGVNDITPALAYLTNKPLLNNIVDTNANIFRKGFLDANVLTADAVQQKAMLVGHGAIYPELGVEEKLLDEIFDLEKIKKSCRFVTSTPVFSEGITNSVTIFSCQ